MNQMRKLTSILVIFIFLVLPANVFAKEKRGANLVIQKKNGQKISGELITMKKQSMLLWDFKGTDVSVYFNEIQIIQVKNKSEFWKGSINGFVLGGVFGFAFVHGQGGAEALLGTLLLGVPCALAGGLFGAAAGNDRVILFDIMSDSEKEEVLQELSSLAFRPDFQ
jgi:hypothetical protein